MADKTINDLTATSALNDGDLFELENTGNNSRKITAANLRTYANGFRGATVKKSGNQTGLNLTTATAVAWDAEVRDTGAYHDTVTDNSRLTIVADGKVRIRGQVQLLNATSGIWVVATIRKNGSQAYDGFGKNSVSAPLTSPTIQVQTALLDVVATDYFELFIQVQTDTSVDIEGTTGSFFELEVVE